jgi:hypothetical protein
LINFKVYSSAEHLPDSWDNLPINDVFLKRHFLEGLERAYPDNISVYYIGVFSDANMVGIAIVQRVKLYAKEMFRNNSSTFLKQVLKSTVAGFLKGNILVVGNLMHTGQHGVYFNIEQIHVPEYINVLFKALKEIQQDIKTNYNKKIRLILFKDYFEDDKLLAEVPLFKLNGFYKVKVQPNMIMNIRSNWQVFENYVSAMNTKYRTRYKRALKKFGVIKRNELSESQIEENHKELYKLYLNVSNNASFNTFILPENHFLILKRQLKSNFKVFGYYLNNQLIGFYTLILNNSVLETYFLGYDEEHQYQNQLYLNMLYDMAKYGINNKFSSVVYARTAMEIKSSVGAKPKEMYMYMKHTNNFANMILRVVFNLLNPKRNWEERHPFK